MTANRALELELRRLPSVAGVAFRQEEGRRIIHVLLEGPASTPGRDVRALVMKCLRQEGLSAGDEPLTVEFEMLPAPTAWRGPRVQIIAVRADRRGEIEVHLAYRGQRAVGRSKATSASSAADATLTALRHLRITVPFKIAVVEVADFGATVILQGIGDGNGRRLGVASGPTSLLAASRATLHALNRYLDLTVQTYVSPSGGAAS